MYAYWVRDTYLTLNTVVCPRVRPSVVHIPDGGWEEGLVPHIHSFKVCHERYKLWMGLDDSAGLSAPHKHSVIVFYYGRREKAQGHHLTQPLLKGVVSPVVNCKQ